MNVFILCPSKDIEEGLVYTIDTEDTSVLVLFEQRDDALRYSERLFMSGEESYEVVELDKDIAVELCEMQGYNYTIVTPDNLVLPL